MALDSAAVVLFTILPLVLLVLWLPDAELSLNKYINEQVLYSLKSVKTRNSRLYIVLKLCYELIPAFCLFVLLLIWGWRKKYALHLLKNIDKNAIVFILLGLSGVLPIMISLKQSGFYILATFPFFAIGLGIIINPLIDFLLDIITQKKAFIYFKRIAATTFFLSITLCFYFSSHFAMDKNKLEDTYKILKVLPTGSIINIHSNMWQDWSLHGYYARYKNVSLDRNNKSNRQFLLIQKEYYSDSIRYHYKKIEIQTVDYMLFEKK